MDEQTEQVCAVCQRLRGREEVHSCWRCGGMVCQQCSYPDRYGDYECTRCLLWQRTREVLPEPSFDD